MTTVARQRAKGSEPRLPSPLERRFEAVVFDWDGTAVPDRRADASELRALIEGLCSLGFDFVVVTGTHVGNVDGQLRARPAGPGRLYLCVNRGSEVFEATAAGVELIYRRQATPEEEAALDAAATATVAELARHGLSAEVVSQRLNRRKIDLSRSRSGPIRRRRGSRSCSRRCRNDSGTLGWPVSAPPSRSRSRPRRLPGWRTHA